MKIITTIIYIFCSNILFAQANLTLIEVGYLHSTQMEGMPNVVTVEAKLVANGLKSIYEMDYVGMKDFMEESDSDSGIVLNVKPSSNPKVFKDYKDKIIYSVGLIGMKPYIVKDKLTIFNWTLTSDVKDILGYKCQQALMHFRGRDYIAYFTTEIPLYNGPWKFDKLPGLILEIKSTDNAFKIEATNIKLRNINSLINYPFNTKIEDSVSWDEFVALYKKKNEELEGYTMEHGSTVSLPKRKIEVIIED